MLELHAFLRLRSLKTNDTCQVSPVYRPMLYVLGTDLKLAAQQQQTYLESQKVTIPVTVHDFPTKKEQANVA